MDLTGPHKGFCILKCVKMPISYTNIYKTPSNGTKPGVIR